MAKPIEINSHGNYVYGTLDGVDFVSSGKFENGQTYGASVKLKFIMKALKTKAVNGVDITTTTSNSQIIQIKCQDDDLQTLVHKYNELDGKELLINYSAQDGSRFVINDEKDIIALK